MAPLANTTLFTPLKLGDIQLDHRVIMAPLTRVRAPEHIPDETVVEYYRQRASRGGLLISEATHISVMGGNYHNAPGIFTPEQTRAWRAVTTAVHAGGGYIFCQLWHIGRAAVPVNLGGRSPVGPSANRIPAGKTFFTPTSSVAETVTARAMTAADIADTIADYAHAARCAVFGAGFDGVEIHAANGYLLDQFLCDNINERKDAYGASPDARARLCAEVVEAVAAVVGRGRVGVRFSPWSAFQGTRSSDVKRDYGAALRAVDRCGVAYVHLIGPAGSRRGDLGVDVRTFREMVKSAKVIVTEGVAGVGGVEVAGLQGENAVDALVFGRLFISNPDLVERLRNGWPLAEWDQKTFYTKGPKGYTDYPRYRQQEAKI